MKTMVKMVMVNIKLFISKSGKANKRFLKMKASVVEIATGDYR